MLCIYVGFLDIARIRKGNIKIKLEINIYYCLSGKQMHLNISPAAL